MKLPGFLVFVLIAGYLLLATRPRWRLSLDLWLSGHQKRKLREVLGRTPMVDDEFIVRMEQQTTDGRLVSKVRQRVAEGVAFLVGHSVSGALIYPQDQIVADLGIGAGLDDDTAIILALENDLAISLPDQETETVSTVEDLIHLCERRSQLAPPPGQS